MGIFYVGQKVKTIRVDDTDTFQGIPHGSEVELLERQDRYGTWYVVDLLGIHAFCKENRLVPIKPKIVLTEWQIQGLKDAGFGPSAIDRVQSILSEPEPPKYQPKKGEGVLVRSNHTDPWHPRVFTEMNGSRYQCYALIDTDKCNWNYCIQFDAALIGKVTD